MKKVKRFKSHAAKSQPRLLSANKARARAYREFLGLFDEKLVTVEDLVQFGCMQMNAADLHDHHFEFSANPLRATAQHLAFHALKIPLEGDSKEFLKCTVSRGQAKRVCGLFEKRIAKRLPAAYITGTARYLGNTFYVNRHVLIPRSAMTFHLEDYLKGTHWQNYRVLDLCAGSGCIGITLALLHPDIKVDLVDISEAALRVARRNIKRFSLGERVKCVRSDVFQRVRGEFDLIITNPPYVSTDEYRDLAQEFRHEPKLALECGKDGLDIVHQILQTASVHLNPAGKLIAEVGATAVDHLKAAYPKLKLRWQKYKRPDGSTRRRSVDCIFWIDSASLSQLKSSRPSATKVANRARKNIAR